MKAVVVEKFGAFDSAAVRETPDPQAGPEEVVVAVKAADVNFPDVLLIEGKYQIKPRLPFSPGMAAAGTVESVGAGVAGLKPGDRVLANVEFGAFAEKLAVPAVTCHRLPDALSFEKAAAMGLVYLTAFFALKDRAAIREGETVLVLGAKGGIGVASIQLARALGAGMVIAGVRDEEKIVFTRSVGADHVVDLNSENLSDDLRNAVREITDGRGVDIVIDPVGGEVTRAALRTLAWRGRLVVVGFASGSIPAIKTNYLLVKNIAIFGLQLFDYLDRLPGEVAAAQSELFRLYEQGRIDPFVSMTLPLERYAEALDRIREGRVMGKVVLATGN